MNKKNNISLFAVSFSQGFISPNIPIATFQQGSKDIVFLLDTGSDNNVINKEALEYVEHEMYDTSDRVTTLSGVRLSIVPSRSVVKMNPIKQISLLQT